MTFGQVQRMTLTFDIHSTSLTHLAECFKPLWDLRLQMVSKKKIHFLPYKSLCNQIWPWCKIGQGQSKVIIWTTLVELPYTMLHTKFQGHRSIGSGEEDFLRFLLYGHGGHVGHVTQLICINFHSYSPSNFHMNFGSKLPYCFWEKRVLT